MRTGESRTNRLAVQQLINIFCHILDYLHLSFYVHSVLRIAFNHDRYLGEALVLIFNAFGDIRIYIHRMADNFRLTLMHCVHSRNIIGCLTEKIIHLLHIAENISEILILELKLIIIFADILNHSFRIFADIIYDLFYLRKRILRA